MNKRGVECANCERKDQRAKDPNRDGHTAHQMDGELGYEERHYHAGKRNQGTQRKIDAPRDYHERLTNGENGQKGYVPEDILDIALSKESVVCGCEWHKNAYSCHHNHYTELARPDKPPE
jgi:hypothetical protein